MNELQIDNEFKSLIPALTKEEYTELEKSLIKEGCRDSLVVWDNTIIDGHNRYEICTRLDIPFGTKEHQFNNRDEAKEWIIRNQFGRRNISVNQRSLLALQLDSIVKAKAKESQIRKPGSVLALAPKQTIHTDKELAKTAGVSPKTIQYARIIQNEGTEEQKRQFETGEKKIKTIYKEIRKPKPKKEQPKPDIKPNKHDICRRNQADLLGNKRRRSHVKNLSQQQTIIPQSTTHHRHRMAPCLPYDKERHQVEQAVLRDTDNA